MKEEEISEDKEFILDIDMSKSRVMRGGSFVYLASLARSASRNDNAPAYRGFVIGFRPARTFTP
jgi:formylglycine-generating enzyme required for sulfatase activity